MLSCGIFWWGLVPPFPNLLYHAQIWFAFLVTVVAFFFAINLSKVENVPVTDDMSALDKCWNPVMFGLTSRETYGQESQAKCRLVNTIITYIARMMYVTADIRRLAGNAARGNKTTRIIPRHLHLAVRNDEGLKKLLAGVTIAQGSVLLNIRNVLLLKKVEKKRH